MRYFIRLLAGAALLALPTPLLAQTEQAQGQPAAGQSNNVGEIIVTAQKREESVNRVPLTIAVQTAEQLNNNGVVSLTDLGKVVPALTVAPASFGATVFLIRGIGYYDQSIASSPAVSFYVDEAPLPFPAEAGNALFDASRVEVLKGPQGLLFGENSTGGAINVIAAKPTNTLEGGVDLNYGTFDTFTGSAYVSGPISDTLSVRVAGQTTQSGPWQRSYTRDAGLGRADKNAGRIIFDWHPRSDLHAELNINGWHDSSETQAGQFVFYKPSANNPSPIATFPFAPDDARAADWNPNQDYRRNDRFFQTNLRVDYDLSEHMTLTSLTSYSHFRSAYQFEADGTIYFGNNFLYRAAAHTAFEEVRLSGQYDHADWLLGAQYHTDETSETYVNRLQDSTLAPLNVTQTQVDNHQDPVRKAVYGNFNWHPTDVLTLRAGVRYSTHDRSLDYCYTSADAARLVTVTNQANAGRATLGLPPLSTPLTLASCLTLDPTFTPGPVMREINEDTTSWRVGADWQIAARSMLYASVSRGFKDGAFNASGSTQYAQTEPVAPEELISYEAGAKLGLANGMVQLNGAVYHYDYSNKQILGFRIDPTLGSLNQLVGIPKAKVDGAEIELMMRPFTGLTLTASANYNKSEVTSDFVNPDAFGNSYNFKGTPLPRSPEWAADLDAQYEWDLSEGLTGFVGGHVNYIDEAASAFSSPADPRSAVFVDPARTLVDLRLGVEGDRWRLMLWARNVTDEYYYSVYSVLDTIDRSAGRPRTVGVDLSFKFQ